MVPLRTISLDDLAKRIPYSPVSTTFNELIKNPKLSQMITELIETMKEDYQLDIGMIQEMPIRALASFQVVDQEMVNRLVTILNILNK